MKKILIIISTLFCIAPMCASQSAANDLTENKLALVDEILLTEQKGNLLTLISLSRSKDPEKANSAQNSLQEQYPCILTAVGQATTFLNDIAPFISETDLAAFPFKHAKKILTNPALATFDVSHVFNILSGLERVKAVQESVINPMNTAFLQAQITPQQQTVHLAPSPKIPECHPELDRVTTILKQKDDIQSLVNTVNTSDAEMRAAIQPALESNYDDIKNAITEAQAFLKDKKSTIKPDASLLYNCIAKADEILSNPSITDLNPQNVMNVFTAFANIKAAHNLLKNSQDSLEKFPEIKRSVSSAHTQPTRSSSFALEKSGSSGSPKGVAKQSGSADLTAVKEFTDKFNNPTLLLKSSLEPSNHPFRELLTAAIVQAQSYLKRCSALVTPENKGLYNHIISAQAALKEPNEIDFSNPTYIYTVAEALKIVISVETRLNQPARELYSPPYKNRAPIYSPDYDPDLQLAIARSMEPQSSSDCAPLPASTIQLCSATEDNT